MPYIPIEWRCVDVLVCVVSGCTANNVSTASAGLRQKVHSWRRRRRKDDKRGRSREGRWWRFKATEVYFNGLFCIPLVAAGFWKTLHTVTISLAKGKKAKTQQQQQCLAADHTSHYIDRFSGQSWPAQSFFSMLWKPQANSENQMPQKSVHSHLIQAWHDMPHCFLFFYSSVQL